MEGYFLDKTVSDDKALIQNLKRQINQWAASYRLDEFKYLANKIEFGKIIYRPVYPSYLDAQFESRKKKEDYRPYTNQQIPERVYFNLSSLNIWEPTLPLPRALTEQTKSYIVPGSQYVKTCHHCAGTGTITCPKCSGAGKVVCHSCSGSGKQRCSSCGGRGHIHSDRTCTACSGRGRWSQEHGNRVEHYTCSSCNGTGRIHVDERCSRCRGTGQVSCSTCHGTGKETCSRCGGRGEITCTTCEGHKRLYHYFAIEQDLSHSRYSINYICNNFEKDFLEFYENWQNIEGITIFEFSSSGVMENPIDPDHDLFSSVGTIIENSNADQHASKRILFEQLDIQRIDTWELHYVYNGKNYRMLFHGEDLQVIPGKSPIYDYCQNLYKEGWEKYNSGNYTAAGKIVNRLERFDTYEMREKVAKLKADVDEKLLEAYHAGALAGSLVFGLIAVFAIYTYCRDYNHVLSYMGFLNRSSNWFHDYHTGAQMLLGLVPVFFGYISSAAVGAGLAWRVPGNIPRFMTGVIGSVFFIGLYMLVWWVANVVGLTFLATIFVWGICKILIALFIVLAIIWKIISWIWGLIF